MKKKNCPCEYMSDFEKFKEELSSKEKFYSSSAGKTFDKEYGNFLKVWNENDERVSPLIFKSVTFCY